ncbi:MAG: prepilin-type N-terminal cleavage/methylation domain-containing protein [Lentisphaeria bacterium]|nr:prepilin-type N-terminal cleavage/methylation domain-containing protein [Lentisphaeria bacterium]
MKKQRNIRRKSKVFTLIELLVVIAIIAILLRSKWLFFLLFSAIFAFSMFDKIMINTQIPNVTFRMIPVSACSVQGSPAASSDRYRKASYPSSSTHRPES